MMNVYKVTGILPSAAVVERYIRTTNERAAKVRAYKAFNMRAYGIMAVSVDMLQDLGRAGYDIACNEAYTSTDGIDSRSMLISTGVDNTGRHMYRPREATKTKVDNFAKHEQETLHEFV